MRRKHHNKDGRRGIKTGSRSKQIERIAKRRGISFKNKNQGGKP